MVANLDYTKNGEARMAFVGNRSEIWHGEGQEVPNELKYDIAAFIKAAHLDTEVGCKKLKTVDDQEIAERYTYCKTTGKLFGCVGPRYVPLQNQQAFDWFQPWLETKEVSLTTAGALFDGKKVWVQALIEGIDTEIKTGDKIRSLVMLSNSHDGSTAVRVGLTPQRVVCSNTLAAAHSNRISQLIRVKHGKNVVAKIDNIRETIDLIRQEFVATIEQYRKLAVKGINPQDLERFVKIAFGVENEKKEDISTKTLNQIDLVYKRYNNEIAIAGNTLWNAYNAVNGYLNHDYGRSADTRFDSLIFGENHSKDKNMLDLALTLAN